MSRATPGATALAVVAYLASVAALSVSDARVAAHAPGVTKLDLRFGYSHGEVVAVLEALGEAGRHAYALNLAIDSLMPVFLCATTLLVVARASPRWLGLLGVAPVVFLVLDLVENVAFALMLIGFPDVTPALVAASSTVNMVKLSAFFVVLPTLVLGALTIAMRWGRAALARPAG